MCASRRKFWWRSLTEDDPITLEPISELPVPPFELHADDTEVTHYFDGSVLAKYMLSHGKIENPFTREPLRREECHALDEHLRVYDPESATVSVLEAFELAGRIKVKKSSAEGSGAESAQEARETSLRREAAVALQNLFQYRKERSNQRAAAARAAVGGSGGSICARGSGWAMIDDDEERTSRSDMGPLNSDSREEFPELYEGYATAPVQGEGGHPALDHEAIAERIVVIAERNAAQAYRESLRSREAHEKWTEKRRNEIATARDKQREVAASMARMEREEAASEIAASRRAQLAQDQAWDTAEAKTAVFEKELAEARARREAKRVQDEKQKALEAATAAAAEEAAAEEAQIAMAEDKAERERQKKAQKRKKQKEKQKAAKREEAAAKAAADAKAAQDAEKAKADTKCGGCGEGLLGPLSAHFERLGYYYCSTKCVAKHRAELEA